jgi:Lon protease-like protein
MKSPDFEVLPMFPLGVYTPQSNQVLNIFEPRYRKMYNDILMNGSKRFVVTMSHPTERGKFAQIGVIFQLEDLKEVSELTADQVKYICDHRVTDRDKVHRILNPEAWETRETYLQVEATRLKEDDDEGPSKERKGISMINPRDVYLQIAKAATGGIGEMDSEEEKLLRKSFSTLVELQYALQEDVRFTKASINTLKVKPGSGKDSLWETVRLWQAYSDNRLQARQADLQKEFQEKLLKFLQNQKKEKDEKIPR